MTIQRHTLVTVIVISVTICAFAEDDLEIQKVSFICKGAKSVGFSYDNADYEVAHFDVSENTFIVSPRNFEDESNAPNLLIYGTDTEKYKWMVSKMGSPNVSWCTEQSVARTITCDNSPVTSVLDFRFYADKMIYLRWYPRISKYDTPMMEYGKCAVLNIS